MRGERRLVEGQCYISIWLGLVLKAVMGSAWNDVRGLVSLVPVLLCIHCPNYHTCTLHQHKEGMSSCSVVVKCVD